MNWKCFLETEPQQDFIADIVDIITPPPQLSWTTKAILSTYSHNFGGIIMTVSASHDAFHWNY
jgi:hypothetical protein